MCKSKQVLKKPLHSSALKWKRPKILLVKKFLQKFYKNIKTYKKKYKLVVPATYPIPPIGYLGAINRTEQLKLKTDLFLKSNIMCQK